MTTPQLENGFTPIANEILEALAKVKLNGYEWRIVMYIIRKTYGWQKKSDWISSTQISYGTGIPRPHVSRALKNLALRLIVTKFGNKHIGFNKKYTQWLPYMVTNKSVPDMVTRRTRYGNKSVPDMVHTKERKKLNKRNKKDNPFWKLLEYAQRRIIPKYGLEKFEYEFERFWAYYAEGEKISKSPAMALLNWMKPQKWDKPQGTDMYPDLN